MMAEEKIKQAVEEALELKKKLHQKFAEKLDSGNYQNGEKLKVQGDICFAEVWIKSGNDNRTLKPEELADVNTRYKMTYGVIGSPTDPIRLGLDNNHDIAHLDVPGVKKAIPLPLKIPTILGIVVR
jgi:hypothetical protein